MPQQKLDAGKGAVVILEANGDFFIENENNCVQVDPEKLLDAMEKLYVGSDEDAYERNAPPEPGKRIRSTWPDQDFIETCPKCGSNYKTTLTPTCPKCSPPLPAPGES